MKEGIEAYLDQLRAALAGSDRATIQDALADAEEHLRTALEAVLGQSADIPREQALASIVEAYGSPEETAAAYRGVEALVHPALAVRPKHLEGRSMVVRFFGVIADPTAWGAFLYMFLSLFTGVLYSTWALTGLSLSLGMMVLIIGVPFAVLFLLSVRGIALVEGRLVEALLGVRMPRRPTYSWHNLGWWERFKLLVVGKYTWLSIAYMVLLLPLGVLYFTVSLLLTSLSLSFILTPVLEWGFHRSVVYIEGMVYTLPYWFIPLVALAGLLLIPATLHVAKLAGRVHGALAKAMLVSD